MKAIVCDKCGKTVLLPDVGPRCDLGFERVFVGGTHDRELDLCDECVDQLMEAAREVKDGAR